MSGPVDAADRELVVEVWSDVMCPFCYLGHTVLHEAIDAFEHADRVQVRYRSYQLMPDLPTDTPTDLNALLSQRQGVTAEQLEAGHRQLMQRGAEAGLEYRFDQTITINTRTAHRLTHFAASQGAGEAMVDALFRAHFTDGKNIADIDTLVTLAGAAGLDENTARDALSGDAFDTDVTADVDAARQRGIQGVPYFLIDGTYALSGAQPRDAFVRALVTAWDAARTPAGDRA